MKIYRSTPQKSSNLTESSLKVNYGLSPSVAAWGIKGGMAAHLRIYEAALRVGLEHMHFCASELIAWLGAPPGQRGKIGVPAGCWGPAGAGARHLFAT